ncbi:MAG TPA: hypothetical protein VMY06_14845 [Sedimentisphaerales bacterium]|nr:hypothetical protein [Sedimentisphaerales bacterium]HUU15582.1 hypothetical protein [Sedimentisphaerales bacterium]
MAKLRKNVLNVKKEIEEFDEKLRKQKRRRGPWKDSIKDLPPEEQGKLFAKRLLGKVFKAKPKKKKK